METPTLLVKHLQVSFFTERGEVRAANDVSLEVRPGQIVGIVGESGCGKSVCGRAIMGLLRPPGRVVGGRVLLNGQDLLGLSEDEWCDVRGSAVSMIFQEPMTSLNPLMRVGKQVAEAIKVHTDASNDEAMREAERMLEAVGIADARRRMRSYPHQLSGGLRQRVMIAMAMALRPRLLVADEPTTALDVTVQAQILRLMRNLAGEDTSVLIISHDLGVIAQLCDYVYVMYAGRVVEQAPTVELFDRPAHPYTKGLLAAVTSLRDGSDVLATIPGTVPNLLHLPPGCSFSLRCERCEQRCREVAPELVDVGPGHAVRCLLEEGARMPSVLLEARHLTKEFAAGRGKKVHAVSDVSLELFEGETLGIVGESGCGKSTLARMLIRLLAPTSGEVLLRGQSITGMSNRAFAAHRRELQLVFQDPYASLDPRMTVRELIAEPLRTHHMCPTKEATTQRVLELMGDVGVPSEFLWRYPHQFSGGQRQRIGIARALAAEPSVIVCDEPVSALDVSVQSQILNLLRELQRKNNLSFVFISHDLSVIRHVSDRVCVMFLGRVCEMGPTNEVFDAPRHPYTRFLINAIPSPDPHARNDDVELLEGEIPSPLDPPSGCPFRTHCPQASERCAHEAPTPRDVDGVLVACHHPHGMLGRA
ncbi:MAG: ABC transporter ATP-binding protein [Coriobacteriales bacterium]|nr:ABC transporter ATP-binding protein [Coriobacteriales bacterium]